MHQLRQLLVEPIEVVEAKELRFAAGHGIPDEVVDCARLILLPAGRLTYRIEEAAHPLAAPMMLFVPAWVRRHWRAEAAGNLLHAAFTGCDDWPAMVDRAPDEAVEEPAFQRMVTAMRAANIERTLLAAAEVKAALVRFMLRASPLDASSRTGRMNPAVPGPVAKAVGRIVTGFDDPDVLDGLTHGIGMSADHFRRCFKARTGMSPTRFLLVHRMRHARHLLHEMRMMVKEVAAAVGYRDAFTFSRQYKQFWGVSPSDDRA